ncbi:helix-turn-helix transcriptional regulator [Streptomyces sp. NPDC004838]
MSLRDEIRDFLTSRRGRITPENAGLPAYGGRRRVTGLRREEVALLAGVSVDYYNRLERGNLRGVSENVLNAVAQVLQFDEAEHAHLHDLARASNAAPAKRRRENSRGVRPGLLRLLDAMAEAPAGILNARLDVLAANRLGRALYASALSGSGQPANLARFAFLDPRSKDFYADWETTADDTVAILRSAAGGSPYDRVLSDLIGELSVRSEDFRSRWAAHHVRFHRTGVKKMRHPAVGDLTLSFEALHLDADPGLVLLAYTAEAGSASEDALRTLAEWAATRERNA